MNSLSERIKFIRKSLGLKQIEFAQKIGVSQASLSDFENGNKSPSVETLLAISNFTGFSVDWILKGDLGSEDMEMLQYRNKVLTVLADTYHMNLRFFVEDLKIPREILDKILAYYLQSMYNTQLSKDEKQLLHILSGLNPKQKHEFFDSLRDLVSKYKMDASKSS